MNSTWRVFQRTNKQINMRKTNSSWYFKLELIKLSRQFAPKNSIKHSIQGKPVAFMWLLSSFGSSGILFNRQHFSSSQKRKKKSNFYIIKLTFSCNSNKKETCTQAQFTVLLDVHFILRCLTLNTSSDWIKICSALWDL